VSGLAGEALAELPAESLRPPAEALERLMGSFL
jgi:hypothetical protein